MNEVVTKDRQILNQMFAALTAQTDRLDNVENRMGNVELLIDKEVYMTPRQTAKFRKTLNARVRELLPDKDDYKLLSRKYFSAFYNELYSRFAIGEYRELPRKEFDAALLLIRDWEIV